ncbi:MAG: PaaI family thioesterase [Thermoanaerobaculia bacterium]|nr:PaaI family thioesterase [Thermoanaerobaculia bacterium]
MSFNHHLGLRIDDGHVVLDTRPEHQIMPGTIHFAVLCTLAEVAAAGAAQASVVPAQVSLSLLRRAEPGRLVGRGTLIRRGRKLAVCEGEVFQDSVTGKDDASEPRLVAKATVQFAVLGG